MLSGCRLSLFSLAVYNNIRQRRNVLKESKMNKSEVFETLKVDEGVKYEIYNDHLGYQPLVSAISYSKPTQSTDNRPEQQSLKKESRSVLITTSVQRYQSVTLYTDKGLLTTYQTKYKVYLLT